MMDDFKKMILESPEFIQACKDFERMGFIKIENNLVKIIDAKGLQAWIDNYGKWQSDTKH
tara:strand:+ start:366 stop:545 length:180 start_codon:yes stop_codon:yes gene_type:complete